MAYAATVNNNGMEVDPPAKSFEAETLGLNPLKRSNSAPMLVPTTASTVVVSTYAEAVQCTTAYLSTSFSNHFTPRMCERTRRYSTSNTNLCQPTTPIKIPSRLDQLKFEERINVKELEAAQEKDVHSAMQLSQSWEELSLSEHEPMDVRRPRSFQEPLHILTPPYPYTSSPSPTRNRKQCFSPSLGYPVSNHGNALSPSPSPTRKFATRRSHSPIIFAPSRLGSLKRKINVDSDTGYESYTPPKRVLVHNSASSSPYSTTPESQHTASHPLLHSISSSSMSSDNGSPEQQNNSTIQESYSHSFSGFRLTSGLSSSNSGSGSSFQRTASSGSGFTGASGFVAVSASRENVKFSPIVVGSSPRHTQSPLQGFGSSDNLVKQGTVVSTSGLGFDTFQAFVAAKNAMANGNTYTVITSSNMQNSYVQKQLQQPLHFMPLPVDNQGTNTAEHVIQSDTSLSDAMVTGSGEGDNKGSVALGNESRICLPRMDSVQSNNTVSDSSGSDIGDSCPLGIGRRSLSNYRVPPPSSVESLDDLEPGDECSSG